MHAGPFANTVCRHRPTTLTVALAAPADRGAREGWVEAITAAGAVAVVDLLLDGPGEVARAVVPADDVEWLGLRVGDIVRVRPDP